MQKRTIHLVYTVPTGNLFRRAIDKCIRVTGIIAPLHRYGIDFLIPWRKPTRSPHSVSLHLLHELKKYGKVRFYSLYEKGVINLDPEDIFLGEPIPAQGFVKGGRPQVDDKESITSQTLRKNKNNLNKFLITPFSNDSRYIGFAKDLAENYANKVVLGQTGEIWTKNWKATPFGNIAMENVLRLDNAIDQKDYPLVKKSFSPKGSRKFLYVGHTEWYKNTQELERIAEQMPGFEGGHIGGGIVKGWKKIADFAELTPKFMIEIAREYDFFINTSSGDPQATTILENICFGFPIACTPETGYDYPSIIKLDAHDTEKNIETLSRMQHMDESELQDLVRENLKYVEEKHSWEIFLKKITRFMNLS